MGPLELLIIVALPVGIGVYMLSRRLTRWRAEAARQVRTLAGGRPLRLLDETANFFGMSSYGLAQVRGNGCLAATDEEVLFVMWAPRRTLRISRAAIEAVETPRSHLGKTKGFRLLRLRFHTAEGREDAVAWLVSDLDRWVRLLSRSE